MPKVDSKLVDQMAELEVQALLEGLDDPELRKNPAFLAKVRQFLKDNRLETTAETPGVAKLQKQVIEDIPIFDDGIAGGYDVDRRTN